MPKYFAIEWDSDQARGVFADTAPDGDVRIEKIITVPLAKGEHSPDVIGRRLAEAAQPNSIARANLLVALVRSCVNLKVIQLPPAPAEELPDMVRFQAQREMPALEDDSIIDFCQLDTKDDHAARLLVGALTQQQLNDVRKVAEIVAAPLTRVQIRPGATLAFMQHANLLSPDRVTLVVDQHGSESDLTIAVNGRAEILRSARMPQAAHTQAGRKTLILEVRRMLAAVSTQLEDRAVEQILICGDAETLAPLVADFEEQFSVATQVVNPLDHVTLVGAAADHPPDTPGSLTSLIGMVLAQAAEIPPELNFLDPRRRPEPKSHLTTYLLAAGVLLSILAWYGISHWRQVSDLDAEIAAVKAKIESLGGEINEHYQAAIARARLVEPWAEQDVTWLDELVHLSESLRPLPLDSKEYPGDEDVVVTNLQIRPWRGTGRIIIDAVARNQSLVGKFERRLREGGHDVQSGGGGVDSEVRGYNWKFTTTVTLQQTDEEEL